MNTRFLREPLLHFLILGLLVYVLINQFSPTEEDFTDKVVRIDETRLLQFIQGKPQNLNPTTVQETMARMSTAERESIIRQITEQEVLFREAKKLGLDKNDSVLRHRLIQKMRYLLEGISNANIQADTEQVSDYFLQNKQNYQQAQTMSFTHLFFKHDEKDKQQATKRAEKILQTIALKPDADQSHNSDYFPFHRNYIKKSADQIARHFGKNFANTLFSQMPPKQQWHGPISSAYGQHLVLVFDKQPAFTPDLQSIYPQVKKDAQRQLLKQAQQKQITRLTKKYNVIVDIAQP